MFPTRFRAFAHGISAAAGKCGAIISALAFNLLSQKIGTPHVLWSTCVSELRRDSYLTMAVPSFLRLLRVGCWYVSIVYSTAPLVPNFPFLLVFTLLLPEVRGRDPDQVYLDELREQRA